MSRIYYKFLLWTRAVDCILNKKKTTDVSIAFLSHYKFQLRNNPPYTLQSRFVKYIRESNKFRESTVQTNNCITFVPSSSEVDVRQLRNSLTDISTEQLPQFVYNLHHYVSSLNKDTIQYFIKIVDQKCISDGENMDDNLVLKTVDAWFYILANGIINLQFYSLFLNKMSLWLSISKHQIDNLIQPMFYIGLQKRTKEARNIMRKCLIHIDHHLKEDISIEELCILTDAAYKTSTKITSSKLLTFICHIINSNLISLLSDEALLVTLIKSLRHAQYNDLNVMDNIANVLTLDTNLMKQLTFTAKVHILALYADALYVKDNFISALIDSSINDLLSSFFMKEKGHVYLTKQPRVKDITRFLWAVSYMGVHIKNVENIIVPYIYNRLDDYQKYPEEIINSLLSLWMMGHKPKDLFKAVVTKGRMEMLKNKGRFRYNARLALLLRCIGIEEPEFLNEEQHRWMSTEYIKPNLERELLKRNVLHDFYSCIKCLSGSLKYEDVKFEYVIPNINIASIVMRNMLGSKLVVEILDPVVCLYNSPVPHGLMKLKLRLLETLGCELLIISQNDFHYLNDISNLYMFLEDEIVKCSRCLVTTGRKPNDNE